MTEYIDLNMSNYTEDDVAQLNDWAIEAADRIDKLTAGLNAIKNHQEFIGGDYAKLGAIHRMVTKALRD
jgi:hypothetical protein